MNRQQKISYIVSFALHMLLFIIISFIKLQHELEDPGLVEIGFGTYGEQSSSGSKGTEVLKPAEQQPQETAEKIVKTEEPKKVELPATKSEFEENVITKADDKKEEKGAVKPLEQTTAETGGIGKGTQGESEGTHGFEISFGGGGSRKIYSYILPEYPEGVSKEADVKLRFTILPDGTVGAIFPLIKADARMESEAINSLRQWRFEPLKKNQRQLDQTAIVVFPYRLQ